LFFIFYPITVALKANISVYLQKYLSFTICPHPRRPGECKETVGLREELVGKAQNEKSLYKTIKE
jgi:hypothetical protein